MNMSMASVRGRTASGERNSQAKLCSMDVIVIKSLIREGMKQRDIAVIYRIGQAQIRRNNRGFKRREK